jgi:hypothetical protein
MKKNLVAKLLLPILVGSVFFNNCGKTGYEEQVTEKIKTVAQTLTKKEATKEKGLDSYFFNENELNFLNPIKGKISEGENEFQNLKIYSGDSLKTEGFDEEDTKILQSVGQAEYALPNGQKVHLVTLKFKSIELAEEMEKRINNQNTATSKFAFLDKDVLSYIVHPDIPSFESEETTKGNKQMLVEAISNYVKRTGVKPQFTNPYFEGELKSSNEKKGTIESGDICPSDFRPGEFFSEDYESDLTVPNLDSSNIKEKGKIVEAEEEINIRPSLKVKEKTSVSKNNPSNNLEAKTIKAGLAILTDIFNAEIVFYERRGENIEGNDIYTSDWEEYAETLVKDRGYETVETCSVILKNKNSFVELKAIINNPSYDSFETSSYRYTWENNAWPKDEDIPLVPVTMSKK